MGHEPKPGKTLNEVGLKGNPVLALPLLATPTQLQERALELLGIRPEQTVPSAKAGRPMAA